MNSDHNYEIKYDKIFDKILDTFFAFQKKYPHYVKELKIIPIPEKFKPVSFKFRIILAESIEKINSIEFEYLLEYFYFVAFDDGMTLLECTYETNLFAFSIRDSYFIAQTYLINYAARNSIHNIKHKTTLFEISY